MDPNSVLETRKVLDRPQTSHTIAAHTQRQADTRKERKTDAYKRACDGYDSAHAEFLQATGSVAKARGDRNAAGGAALAGLAIMAMSGDAFLWWLSFVVAIGVGALAIREQLLLSDARDRCQTAIQAMSWEYAAAKRESGDGDDIPPRPTQCWS